MTRFLIGGVGLAALAATAALAQVPPSGARDGVHTKAEMMQHVQTMFSRVDANRDGSVTREEAQALQGEWRAQRQARQGQPGSGAFDRIDVNHDGSITRQEFDAHRAQREARRAEGGPKGQAMRGMMLGGRMFDMADANRDQRVSLQEATAAALRHFDTADLNRDGQVTREERMQMRERTRSERRPS